jgi:DedD protein
VAAKQNIQEYDPRNRLVGAVVLVILAIIFVPMLLDSGDQPGEGDPEQTAVIEIDDGDKKVFVSRISPVTTPADTPAEGASPEDEQTAAPEQTEPDSSALFKPITIAPPKAEDKAPARKDATTRPAPAAESAPEEASKAVKEKPAGKPPVQAGGWLVQIGVFSKPANAEKSADRLRAKGFTVHTGLVSTSKGEATRVWLGPFEERATAERILGVVARSTGQRGIIVANK